MTTRLRRRHRRDRGAAIIEVAITLPLLLLISVATFEFGRAFQTWQVLTNAAREGARLAIIAGSTDGGVITRVQDYLTSGAVPNPDTATVVIDRTVVLSGSTGTATSVTVTYPFEFIVLQPVAQLIVTSGTLGSDLLLEAVATMRNET
jgi:Flp pilus assembly protein TadG